MDIPLLKILNYLYGKTLRIIEHSIVVFSSVLIIIVFSGVISRYFLNASLAWSEEMSRFLFVWIILLASVLVNDKYGHMQFDYLILHVPVGIKNIIQVLSSLIVATISIILMIGGSIITKESLDWKSPALQIPYAFINCIVIIAFTLILAQTIRRIIPQILILFHMKESET